MSETRIKDAIGDIAVAQSMIDLANKEGANLDHVVTLLLDGGVRVDVINGWLKNGTNLPDAIAIISQGVSLKLIGTSRKVGDFTSLIGTTPNEVVSRIPKDAKILPWKPGRIAQGMKFAWTSKSGRDWEVRMHGPDTKAPAGSNAANGWIMRVQRGKKYMDATGTFYTENAITNPASAQYDPRDADKNHMPIQTP